jgi:hypothetical protein
VSGWEWGGAFSRSYETLRTFVRFDPLLADVVTDLLLTYGFGAKTSSGFGTAELVAPWAKLSLNVMVSRKEGTVRESLLQETKQPDESIESERTKQLQREYEKLRAQHLGRNAEVTPGRASPSSPDEERRYLMIDQRPFEIARLREAVARLLAEVGGAV